MNSVMAIPLFILGVIFWLEGVFPYFNDRTQRWRHAAPNIVIAFLAGVINVLFFLTIMKALIAWANANSVGVLRIIKAPPVVGLTLGFIAFDLWMYAWHRANHRFRLLWLLHRAHHNDTAMDSTTALRFHPVEILISSFLNLVVVGTLGMDIRHLLVYNLVFQPVIFFHHSNIALRERWDRILRAVIVTPNMHRVHHSIETNETNSNYGSIFSFWDRIFCTFRKREDTRTITYGLVIFRERTWQGVRGFLGIPFQKNI